MSSPINKKHSSDFRHSIISSLQISKSGYGSSIKTQRINKNERLKKLYDREKLRLELEILKFNERIETSNEIIKQIGE
jgi:hypothetical protein